MNRAFIKAMSQRRDIEAGRWDASWHWLLRYLRILQWRLWQRHRFATQAQYECDRLGALSTEALTLECNRLRSAGMRGLGKHARLTTAVAMAAEFLKREKGRAINMNQQSAAGSIVRGAVVDILDAEDRRQVLLLSALAGGLLGCRVQVAFADINGARAFLEDYAFLFARWNLRLGLVSDSQLKADRQQSYRSDITLGTMGQFANDVLLDQLLAGSRSSPLRASLEILLRPKNSDRRMMSLVPDMLLLDRAETILLDQARTSVSVSGGDSHLWHEEVFKNALSLARQLQQGSDFYIEENLFEIVLTDKGKANLELLSNDMPRIWDASLLREFFVEEALVVLHLLEPGVDYELSERGIVLLRSQLEPGRAPLNRERLQLLKLETLDAASFEPQELARISLPQLIAGFDRIGGVSTGAREQGATIWKIYGCPVLKMGVAPTPPAPSLVWVDGGAEARETVVLERITDSVDNGSFSLLPVAQRQFFIALSKYLSDCYASSPMSKANTILYAAGKGAGQALLMPFAEFVQGIKMESFSELSRSPDLLILSELPDHPCAVDRLRVELLAENSSSRTVYYLCSEDARVKSGGILRALGFLSRRRGGQLQLSGHIAAVLLRWLNHERRKLNSEELDAVVRSEQRLNRLLAFAGSET